MILWPLEPLPPSSFLHVSKNTTFVFLRTKLTGEWSLPQVVGFAHNDTVIWVFFFYCGAVEELCHPLYARGETSDFCYVCTFCYLCERSVHTWADLASSKPWFLHGCQTLDGVWQLNETVVIGRDLFWHCWYLGFLTHIAQRTESWEWGTQKRRRRVQSNGIYVAGCQVAKQIGENWCRSRYW